MQSYLGRFILKTKNSLLFIFLLGLIHASFAADFELAIPTFSAPQYAPGELNAQYLNSDTARREDEFARSLKRRNYLKDRLVFQGGFGSKYFAHVHEQSQVFLDVAYGVGLEYITEWGVSVFASYGQFGSNEDDGQPANPSTGEPAVTIASASGTRIGLAYYFLPQFALHPGISVSYGKTIVAHLRDPDAAYIRQPVSNSGYNIEASITYLDYNAWYLTMNVGVGLSSDNASVVVNGSEEEIVIVGDKFPEQSGQTWNPVFGFGIGVALADLLPDITEKRRRERAAAWSKIK